MTDRSGQGTARPRRGHQHHPKNIGIRSSNIATSEIIQALKEGRNLETLFSQPQQQAIAMTPSTSATTDLSTKQDNTSNKSISRLNENSCDESKELDNCTNTISKPTSNQPNELIKAKRNSSSSSLNSTPSEKSDKLRKSKNSDAKRKRRPKTSADFKKMERPAAEGAEHVVIEDDDEETVELSKLRCTSERMELIAERENRRQKKCADYPGLAFARSIFSSDSMMKFNIIRNELQNIMNNQLRRVRDYFARTTKHIRIHDDQIANFFRRKCSWVTSFGCSQTSFNYNLQSLRKNCRLRWHFQDKINRLIHTPRLVNLLHNFLYFSQSYWIVCTTNEQTFFICNIFKSTAKFCVCSTNSHQNSPGMNSWVRWIANDSIESIDHYKLFWNYVWSWMDTNKFSERVRDFLTTWKLEADAFSRKVINWAIHQYTRNISHMPMKTKFKTGKYFFLFCLFFLCLSKFMWHKTEIDKVKKPMMTQKNIWTLCQLLSTDSATL